MSSDTEMINVALRKVGAKRITDVGEVVPGAGVAQDVLTQERETLLREHTWNFATKRAELAAMTQVPAFGFQHAFALPSDCVRVVSVHDNSAGCGSVIYKAESMDTGTGEVQALLADATVLYLRYVRRVTDPNLMSPTFRQVLILRLARIFAKAVANSNTLYQLISDELAETLRRARSVDGMEDYPERMPEGSWATTRRGSWGDRRW